MTNEKKIKSLWYNFCTEKDCGGHTHCEYCPKAQVHPQLLEIAEWKEKQMIDNLVEWIKEHWLDLIYFDEGNQEHLDNDGIEMLIKAMKG